MTTGKVIWFDLPHGLRVRGEQRNGGASEWTVFGDAPSTTPLGTCREVTTQDGQSYREGDALALQACRAMSEIERLWKTASEATGETVPLDQFMTWFAGFASSPEGWATLEAGLQMMPPEQRDALLAQMNELAEAIKRLRREEGP